jgi:hypothetical protein
MALPNVKDGTDRVIRYGAEVSGRCLGVAECPNLIPNPETRAELTAVGNRIGDCVQRQSTAWVATALYEYLTYRIAVGRGVGLDRGWDRTVVSTSDGAKEAVPDRNTADPAYRAVFENGTIDSYTKPTIKQDDGLALELRTKIENSGLSNREKLTGLIDAILPQVTEAAQDIRGGEERINELFKTEVNLRQELTDLLWSERKKVEGLLGRSGRSLVNLIFFDFNSPTAARGSAPVDSAPGTDGATPDETPA